MLTHCVKADIDEAYKVSCSEGCCYFASEVYGKNELAAILRSETLNCCATWSFLNIFPFLMQVYLASCRVATPIRSIV